MRHMRRFMPIRGGYGSYPAHVVCYDPRWLSRAGAAQQHTLDLCFLLSLRGTLPSRCPYCGCDVYPEEYGDPVWPIRNLPSHKINTTAADFSSTFIRHVNEFGRSWEFGLATAITLNTFHCALPKYGTHGVGHVIKKPSEYQPEADQRNRPAQSDPGEGQHELEVV